MTNIAIGKIAPLVAAALIAAPLIASATVVDFSLSDVSGNTWQYNYSIINTTQPGNIGEFTVFFAPGQYSNLSVQASPGNWSSVVAQPSSNPLVSGSFDAQALDLGLAPGQSQAGFAVQFTWLGSGTPGSQLFNIVDPTIGTLESGNTTLVATPVPLPAATWLFVSGLTGFGAMVRKRCKLP
jgi:hypothetical protein